MAGTYSGHYVSALPFAEVRKLLHLSSQVNEYQSI